MTPVMESPISCISAHTFPSYPSFNKIPPNMDISHLSGATMADLTSHLDSKVHLVTASTHDSKRSSASRLSSNRCSVASTTKSDLRRSNHLLIEMLQNIQMELTTHRTILLDVQHRVSHLEHESVGSVNNDEAPQVSTLHALEGRTPKRSSRLVPPESQFWWQACQNFARNSETPMSATEFLKTPARFSGLGLDYGVPGTRPPTPPISPPDVEDLPSLTPTSEEGDGSDLDTPRKYDGMEIKVEEVRSNVPEIKTSDDSYDVKEHTVEIDKRKMPAPPTLQSPPAGKHIASSVNISEEVVRAPNPQRFYKGVKSSATYKALMKNKSTDKEHYVLIHFHKRSELKDIDDAA